MVWPKLGLGIMGLHPSATRHGRCQAATLRSGTEASTNTRYPLTAGWTGTQDDGFVGIPAKDNHPAQFARTGGNRAHLFRPGGRVTSDLHSCQRKKSEEVEQKTNVKTQAL
ncbi:hypothetical protein E2C01_061879 [Portunus trituberculatus]|uniref:Uncharacterized protein n=1 Tax=Portunus trituberculatus TaxID=210409 RepID=A0A5B7HD25_PORTR|nr:hypothetical protein [Portunus trituberculatus]